MTQFYKNSSRAHSYFRNSPERVIDKDVKKRLVEIYHIMKKSGINNPTLNTRENTSIISYNNKTTKSTKKIPRVHSFSPINKKISLPERSLQFYQKLNNFYNEKSQNNKKKNKSLLEDLYSINKKSSSRLSTSNSLSHTKIARVPSLLIKI
jgi:ERCC4-related helicase